MDFDAVEAGGYGILRRLGIFGDRRLDLVPRHRLGRRQGLHALRVGPHLALRRHRRRRQDARALGQVERVADPARVHQLREYLAAGRVNGVGDLFPAGDLRVGKQARNARIAEAVGRRRRALGDDQPGCGTLGIIGRHQVIGHIADRPAARHRRHDDGVGQVKRAERRLRKK